MPNAYFPSLALCLTAPAFAPAGVHLMWERATSGAGDEALFDCARSANGDLIVGGHVTTSTGKDLACTRFAPNGATRWTRLLDVSGDDQVFCVALDANDVAGCFGTTELAAPGQTFGSCAGWAADGTSAFAQPTPALSGFFGAVSTGPGAFALSSLTRPASCFASGASCNWSNTWSAFEPSLHALVSDAAGAVYSAGTRNYTALALRKVTPCCGTAWSLEVPGSAPGGSSNVAYAVALGPGNAVYAAGSTTNLGTQLDAVLVRCDATTGSVAWSRTIDGGVGLADGAACIAVAPTGDVYLGGYTTTTTAQPSDLFVRRYASDGTLLGQAIVDGPAHGDDGATWVGIDPAGDVWVCGTAASATPAGAQVCHVLVARFDAQLVLLEQFVNDSGTGYCDFPWNVTFAPGRGLYMAGTRTENTTGRRHALVQRIGANARTACLGDGSATTCPCGNASAAGARQGCLHSLGSGGALSELGLASLSADDFQLVCASMPDSPALYLQGTSTLGAGGGIVFGDGLRCAGGTVVRLAIRQNIAGGSRYPEAGDLPVSARGLVTTPGERVYQVWYRDSAPNFCTGATFNLTGALVTTWEP